MPSKKTNRFDVLIVGGGIIGMLTARSLQQCGLNVAIFDKGKLGGEATWAAGGILSPLNPWQISAPAESLIREGKTHFVLLADELKQETGIDPEYVQSGMLVLDVDENEIQNALEWAKQNNIILQKLSRQELEFHTKNLAKDFEEALYIPEIAQVRPPRLVAAIKLSLQQRNIKFFENISVNKLIIESGSVSGVETAIDKFAANKVVLCGGAWTNALLQQTTAQEKNLDIEPVRGQMLLYKMDKPFLSHILLKDKSYLIPRRDGHVLCGSTIEHVGFDKQVTQYARQHLHSIAQQILPELANYQPIKQWSALRPGTDRDAPYICKHPRIEGLYLNSGHYRYGIIMSIASARIMSELITNKQNPSHTSGFS